jgi:DNA-directed RNA polymerase specialized sigma24 family protein
LDLIQSGFFVLQKYFFKTPPAIWPFWKFICISERKGKTSPAFADAKGGEYVKPNSHEQDKQRVFDAFCKKVLKYEARDHYDEVKRLRAKEISFSELSERELEQLSTTDKYFATEQTFNVLGDDVIVNDESIAEALRKLPGRKRDIILLSYFLELSDGEIGKKLNLIRSTVQCQRTSTLRELKKFLEEEQADERTDSEN